MTKSERLLLFYAGITGQLVAFFIVPDLVLKLLVWCFSSWFMFLAFSATEKRKDNE